MAKKSAASKGYRKSVKKKPFLTKKEIIALIAIVVAIIAAVVLFNVFYGRGYLKLKDVQPDDVVSMVARDMKNRYVKVADAGQLEGFTRSDPSRETSALGDFYYRPDEPTDNIDYISLSGTYLDAAELTDNSIATLPAYSASDSLVITERNDVTLQGHDAYIFGYTNDYYQAPQDGSEDAAEDTAEDGTPASNRFYQTLSMYVNAGAGRTVCLHISRTGDDDSFYLPDDEIVDYVLGYADKIFTVYEEPES